MQPSRVTPPATEKPSAPQRAACHYGSRRVGPLNTGALSAEGLF